MNAVKPIRLAARISSGVVLLILLGNLAASLPSGSLRETSVAFAQGPVVTAANAGESHFPLNTSRAPDAVVLYDQYNNIGSSMYGSTNFEPLNNAHDTFIADDFVIPNGEFWAITTVEAKGAIFGTVASASVNVFFYTDNAGLPDTQVGTRLNQTYSGAGDHVITLDPPMALGQGHYWVSVQDNRNYADGFWYWRTRSVQSYSPAAYKNPGAAENLSCTNWGTRSSQCMPGSLPDQVFRLSGFRSGPLTAPAFCNLSLITIPASGPASAYPSSITVSGMGRVLSNVVVTIAGLTHTFPDDLDLLLVGPEGQNAIIMSDVGGGYAVNSIGLELDDRAINPLPDFTQLTSGEYRPMNYGTGDTFPSPAPAPSGQVALSTFAGTNPNGTWKLYIVDDSAQDYGNIGAGWCLTIEAPVTFLPFVVR